MCSRKGQLNSIDFTTAMIVFVVLVVFLVTFWFVSVSHVARGIKENKMGAEAIAVSDMLVKSPGIPPHWEVNSTGSTQALGLADSANVLNVGKLTEFSQIDYETSKELLGITHEYYFYIEDKWGNRLYETGNATIEEQAVSVGRFALLGEEKVIMRVVVHG